VSSRWRAYGQTSVSAQDGAWGSRDEARAATGATRAPRSEAPRPDGSRPESAAQGVHAGAQPSRPNPGTPGHRPDPRRSLRQQPAWVGPAASDAMPDPIRFAEATFLDRRTTNASHRRPAGAGHRPGRRPRGQAQQGENDSGSRTSGLTTAVRLRAPPPTPRQAVVRATAAWPRAPRAGPWPREGPRPRASATFGRHLDAAAPWDYAAGDACLSVAGATPLACLRCG